MNAWFDGRITRIHFLIGMVVSSILLVTGIFFIAFISRSIPHFPIPLYTILEYVWLFIVIIFQLSLLARRYRDTGNSGWLSLLYIIPIINIVILLVLFFLPSKKINTRINK